MQVLALIIAVYQRQEHGEMALDISSASEMVQELVPKLPATSSLRLSAPGIVRLMDEDCSSLDTDTLCSLLGEEWMSPELFSACLSHVLPRAGLKVCLEALQKALDQHEAHAAILCESLVHLRV